MSLEIFGYSQSRAFRALWMAEEIKLAKGVDFEHTNSSPMPGPELDALLALNPMGQVPVIRDDGLVLRESMAINLYLAKKYGVLSLSTLEEEALAWQWSFWVMTAVESHTLEALKYKIGMMGVEQNDEKVDVEMEALSRPLSVLEKHLSSQSHLINGSFSVADLNVASVLMWLRMGQIDTTSYDVVNKWLDSSLEREAVTAARQH
ncbi:MAG: glutathione S-transferase family protein [Gammaproteobacteria bacterium]|nr:glutathione S-transferase family protein [Gammaproteobacteria bacterium]